MEIAVFRSGRHTDSNGNTRAWSNEELDRIADVYNPLEHEAPVVIGHPKDNSPAWGWVKSLKRKKDILYANLGGIVPEFEDMLKKGLFKKRSVSFYEDGNLRHVGFLGAMPPSVKGLPDIEFKDNGAEVSISDIEVEKKLDFVDRLKDAFKKEIPVYIERGNRTIFTKKIDNKDAPDTQRDWRSIESFCEDLIKEGRITPSMIRHGLLRFLKGISAIETTYDYSESSEEKTPLEFMEGFLKGLPKVVEYDEMSGGAGKDMDFEALVESYLKKYPDVSYKDAVVAVYKTHPEAFDK